MESERYVNPPVAAEGGGDSNFRLALQTGSESCKRVFVSIVFWRFTERKFVRRTACISMKAP